MARKSIIYKLNDDEFTKLILSSGNLAEVMRKIGLSEKGSNRETIKKRISLLSIDTSHFKSYDLNRIPKNKISLEDILIENSTYQSNHLKKRLFKESLLENKCAICGINSWNNNDIVLNLDHINGNSKDNRIENLRVLCPNCDSQTEFYKGRNKRY